MLFDILRNSLLILICMIGFVAGIIIFKYTKDEVKEGRKFIKLLQNAFFGGIIGTLAWSYAGYFSLLIGIIAFAISFKIKHIYVYPLMLLSILLNQDVALLVFLYGIPTGTLIAK